LNSTDEYRLGVSVGLWKGALIDVGGNSRYRSNQIYKTDHLDTEPNIGFEQNLLHNHFAIRTGLDESSGTAGISIRYQAVIIDLAYVHDLALVRLSNLFGTTSNSVIATFIVKYNALNKK
jgi:hypothetical protein